MAPKKDIRPQGRTYPKKAAAICSFPLTCLDGTVSLDLIFLLFYLVKSATESYEMFNFPESNTTTPLINIANNLVFRWDTYPQNKEELRAG